MIDRASSPLLAVFLILASSLLFSFKNAGKEKSISDFRLLNVDGRMISLEDYPDAKGFIIVFTCNHCPFAKLYTDRLNTLSDKYKALNVPLLTINSMDTAVYEDESFEKMQQKAKTAKFSFPYLHDAKQTVTRDFNAERTPHAFVIWKINNAWIIKYSGAIDNNGAEPGKVTHAYVEEAVSELLRGKQVTTAETRSVGCTIYYRK